MKKMDMSNCPFCHLTVPSLQLERHANNHFEEEELERDIELAREISLALSNPPVNLAVIDTPCETNTQKSFESSSSRCDDKTSGGGMGNIDEKTDILVRLQIKEIFYKVKDGLMVLLRNCLELETENSTSILSGYVDHFQSIEHEDVGWGCGWRNIQMLSSHLLNHRQEARDFLFGGSQFVPDIASLQRWLEIAWERGFDTLGSNDFDRKIYGKRNWIGTTECAALFRSFGLRARIVDLCSKEINSLSSVTVGKRKVEQIYGPIDRFLYSGDHNNTLQPGSSIDLEKVKGQQVLVDWVWNYFSDHRLTDLGNNRVVVSEKPPLYFQHDGHSRTIVGIQVKHQRNGMQQYNLLILDPAHKTEALEKSLRENFGWQKKIKRGVHTLKKPQYQLCYVDPGIAGGEEMEKLKTLDSMCLEF